MCDAYDTCGAPLKPDPSMSRPNKWDTQVDCYGNCDGVNASKATGVCPAGTENFPPPASGKYSGFGKGIWEWSVVDLVVVPEEIEPGKYLMSRRWDCEESTQVWQNCADIVVV